MSYPIHHLTHEQLCDLVLADSQLAPSQAEHLRSCSICAAEYASLQQSLSSFRSATVSWADHTSASRVWSSTTHLLALTPSVPSSALRRLVARPLLWASAAALVLATAIPFALHRHPAPSTARTTPNVQQHAPQVDHIGDEALLEEVDQTLSSSIPAPMQPLADPTAGSSTPIDSTPRKN